MEDLKKLTRNSSKPPNSTSKSSRSFENTAIVGLGIVAAMDDSEQAFASARSSISAILATRSSSATANNSNPIDIVVTATGAGCLFRTSEFLKICFLCSKDLHGRDIFMYRGERAFCSAECRSQHIANDDRKEKCGSGINYSGSPCSGPMMFFAGVVAA